MSKKWTKEQLDKNFEAFLKESMTDSDVTESLKKSKRTSVLDKLGQTPSPPSSIHSSTGKQWWMTEDVDDEGPEVGNSAKSFLKSKDTFPTDFQYGAGDKQNEDKDGGATKIQTTGDDPDAVTASPYSQPGMETIQEEQEKEIFFKQIENNVSDEVNYAKLNENLGNSSTGLKEKKKMLGNVSFLTSNGTLQNAKEEDGIKLKQDDRGLEDSLPPDSTADANMEELQKMLKEAGMSTFGSSFPDLGKTSNTMKDTIVENEPNKLQNEDGNADKHVLSSTPANNNQKKADKVLYGFGLSPVHSADNLGTKTKEIHGFDLSPAHSSVYKENKHNLESGDDLEKIDKIFTENVADRGSAPNFMQAKGASPRHSKTNTKKSGINEETETMMSQVFSSQDGSINSSQNHKQQRKKKGATVNKKTYSAYQRGRLVVTPEKPFAHVPSSGYGMASPMSRKDSVRVSPTRKKSPSPKRRKTPKSTISKTNSAPEQPGEDDKEKYTAGKRKMLNGDTFVLAPNIFRQQLADDHKDVADNRQRKQNRRPLRSSRDSHKNESEILDTVRSLAHLLHGKEKRHQFNDESETHTKVPQTAHKQEYRPVDKSSKDWIEEWKTEHKLAMQLKVELSNALSIAESCKKENEGLKMFLKEIKAEESLLNEELETLKKENYVLSSKLNYALMKAKTEVREKGVTKKKEAESYSTDEEDESTKTVKRKYEDNLEDVSKLKQNLAEQEKLISGYQQENERIYAQLKQAVKTNKENEDGMYEENRILKAEIATLKEVVSENKLIQKHNALDNLQGFNRPQEYNDFTEDIKEAKIIVKNLEFQLQTEIGLHNKTKFSLKNVQKQCQELEKKLGVGAERQGVSLENNKKTYEKEILALKERLKWYAENQLLLDKDQEKLRKQKNEIEELRIKIADMSKIVRMRSTATKDKEQKKIQDLQRQVKELEKILHSRQNPDSVQALVFAAAQHNESTLENKPQSYWENQAHKLQVKLEEKDKETAITLRTVQQQYNKMKLQYESEIDNLETQLRSINRSSMKAQNVVEENKPVPQNFVLKMEQKMKQQQEMFERSKDNFEKQIEYLQLCLQEYKAKTPAQMPTKVAASPNKNKIKQMEERYAQKVGEVEKLNDVIFTLKLDNDLLQNKISIYANKKNMNKKTQKTRQYDPTSFQGEHFTDMSEENKNLQKLVEDLKIDLDKERILKQGVMATAEKDMRIVREQYQLKLSQFQQDIKSNPFIVGKKQDEIETLQTQANVFQNQISVMQEHIDRLKVDNGQVDILKRKEQALQHQIRNLLLEIHSTKMGSKDVNTKSIAMLECKLKALEERHNLKEKELRLALSGNSNAATQNEIMKLENLVNSKNAQITQFRNDLDSILMVLQELKLQGVVIHAPKHMASLLK